MSARRSRPAMLTPFSERLTPLEVAQHWFRRGPDFIDRIFVQYPDFPRPGPDGLYLRESVKGWFSRFHGIRAVSTPVAQAEEEAMRIAKYGRGQNSPPSR